MFVKTYIVSFLGFIITACGNDGLVSNSSSTLNEELIESAASAASEINVRVTIKPVDSFNGAPHINSSYGEIRFYAVGEDGRTMDTDREGGFTLTKKGVYTIGGVSVHNFCYSNSVKIVVDEKTDDLDVELLISCE